MTPVNARELDATIERVETELNRAVSTASRLATKHRDGFMPSQDHGDYRAASRSAGDLADTLNGLTELRGRVQVTSEQRVYGPGSDHSYFADLLRTYDDNAFHGRGEAEQRLARYETELAHEIRRGTPEGRYIDRICRERSRTHDESTHRRGLAENRTLVASGGSTASATGAGVFVLPYVLWNGPIARGTGSEFLSACGQDDLPPYGLKVVEPGWVSGATASTPAEGASSTPMDPVAGLRSGQIQLFTTNPITASQVLIDRAGGPGVNFDQRLAAQLKEDLDSVVDAAVIQTVLAAATPVTGASTFSWASFFGDIAHGRQVLSDTAGTRLRATHVFSRGDFFDWTTHQVDSQGHPIIEPGWTAAYLTQPGDGETAAARFTGTVMPGNALWIPDENIPASGSNDQIIVSAPAASVVVFQGPDQLNIAPEAGALLLENTIRLSRYVGVLVRYPSGTAVITGNAYATSEN